MLQLSNGYSIGNEEGSREGANETTRKAVECEGYQYLQLRRSAMGALSGSRKAEKGNCRWIPGRRREGKVGARRLLAATLSAASLFAADPALQSRIVPVDKQDLIPVYSTYNYSTIVVLPGKEEIKDVQAGESAFWAINWSEHTVSVKPKLAVKLAHKKIDPTNVNIISASGNVYSVVVSEVSGTDQAADLKVILEQKDQQSLSNMEHPKWVRSDYADELKKALEQSKEENAQIKRTAAISEVKEIRHDYEWKAGKESEAFGLKSIYRDSRFTYIEANSQNAPALYEVIDGKESVVQYNLENGKYVVQHIIEHGRLKAGKKSLEFDRIKESV